MAPIMLSGSTLIRNSGHNPVRDYHDAIAPIYDELFGRGGPGEAIRRKVHERLLSRFKAGDRVLELGCGTGTDALVLATHGIHVTATDVSPGMVDMVRARSSARGLDAMISPAVLDAAEIRSLGERNFDGAFSNFDGLNYLPEVRPFAESVGELLRPGGTLFILLLGKVCLWEILYFAATGKPARALRRITRRHEELAVPVRLRLYYPREFARSFSGDFVLRGITGFGLLLPPAGFTSLYKRWGRLFHTMERLESGLSSHYPLFNLCDHYLIELQRRDRS